MREVDDGEKFQLEDHVFPIPMRGNEYGREQRPSSGLLRVSDPHEG